MNTTGAGAFLQKKKRPVRRALIKQHSVVFGKRHSFRATGDVLVALNNSSRGTVVLVPKEFDNAICTSGFLVIVPQNEAEGLLLWYALRSEICRKQIYYLAQTASQPELKLDAWERYFQIPLPLGKKKSEAMQRAKEFYGYLEKLSSIDEYRFNM